MHRRDVIREARKGCVRKFLLQFRETPGFRAYRLISEEHVLCTFRCQQLCLCDGGALEFPDPRIEHHAHHLWTFVGLDVWSQGIDILYKRFDRRQVVLDAFRIDHQRRRVDGVHIANGVPIRHYDCSSKIASISTGMLSGRDPIPTALRTPIPLSSPHTLANSSLQPLMTKGCRPKSGSQFTIPSTFTTLLMRLKLPRLAFNVARIANPTCCAAALPASMVRSLPTRPVISVPSSFTGPCPDTYTRLPT